MPPLLLIVGGFIAAILPSLIARVVIALGIGVVSYVGASIVLDYAFNAITSAFNGLPLEVLQMAGLLELDTAVNIIFGSINARFGLVSMNGIVNRFQISPTAYNQVG